MGDDDAGVVGADRGGDLGAGGESAGWLPGVEVVGDLAEEGGQEAFG